MGETACSSCGTDNPASARFCMECGAALQRSCPACGSAAQPTAKFCLDCGTALEAAASAAVEPAAPAVDGGSESLPEERRQVTVLFADLSGYTAVSESMDPEAVKSVVEGALRRLGAEVTRFGGRVDKYIGDNVMAIFGAPVAHEDDAERAVRSALGMQAAMSGINEGLAASYGVAFALRVGINTGEVLAGAVGEAYTVTGDTVNVASRLQAAAQPGSITVGERTMRTTRDVFVYRRLEPLELKGKREPVAAWEATELAHEQPRRQGRESPLVGRDDELQLLDSLYRRVVREGRPHLVTLVGQAGVGKSRLLREVEQRFAGEAEPPAFRQGRCLPYGSGIVYWALGEVLRSECEIADGDPSPVAWAKLSERLAQIVGGGSEQGERSAERTAVLIAPLLGIDLPDGVEPAPGDDPQRMRESFFSAVRSCVEGMARRQPLVLAFEDIHWADDGMLDLIEHLAQWVRAPLVLLTLARDDLLERRPSWGGGRRSASSISLQPLSVSQIGDLVSALLPDDSDPELRQALVERAGGNPFFAEEMVRRVVEEGSSAAELPDTVQALLAARLDSLEPFERRLVQQAAVVGRTFWRDSLEPIAAAEQRDLSHALEALEEKEILVLEPAAGLSGEPELAFRHVLIRDVAYAMLPKAVRAHKHFEVGGFIEKRAGERSDEVVALLAEHYGRAAALGAEAHLSALDLDPMRQRALHFLEGAGDAAASLYSNPEAFSHYGSARELTGEDLASHARIGEKLGDVALRLGRVDAAIEVWQQCLDFHRAHEDLPQAAELHRKLGAGYAHRGERKQAIEHHQRGINLLKDGEPRLELVRLYEEAAWLYIHTGDNMLAIYASEKALRLAERLGETRAASRAHGIFGRVFSRIGDTEKARENLERSVELARSSDQGETILAMLALGHHLEVSEADYPGAGRAYAEALELAEEVGDVPSQIELHAAVAQLAVYACDWEAVRRSSEASARLATREGLAGKLCLPLALRGLLSWRNGDWAEAIDLYGRAHEQAEQAGWSEIAFSALFGLAAALRDRGDYPAALDALTHALDICERAGLVGQGIQATSARAVVLRLAGKPDQAREAAVEAVALAERLHYPVGVAAALEADGATSDGQDAARLLTQARERWQALGRPVDAARCLLLRGHIQADDGSTDAADALTLAGEEYERLGIGHLSEAARELASTH
ncbi:MAG TPA: adenylate/guanylate cyclase domain-containing protein [Solirubrobacteraceae bacterium]|nr:adenylate/guanylate cyclase domain-containing protein [Solirubrobacteraceae bacterium]